MASVEGIPLFRENIEVCCNCYNPNLLNLVSSVGEIDYVKQKKDYVEKYLINVVVHKSRDLIGIKKCFGKTKTNSRLLKATYRSHQLTLIRFRHFALKNKHLKSINLPATSTVVSVEKYIETLQTLCDTFESILSNIYAEKHMLDLDLVIKSCQLQIQTLLIFEKVIQEVENKKNGRGNETIQYKYSENETIQLD